MTLAITIPSISDYIDKVWVEQVSHEKGYPSETYKDWIQKSSWAEFYERILCFEFCV